MSPKYNTKIKFTGENALQLVVFVNRPMHQPAPMEPPEETAVSPLQDRRAGDESSPGVCVVVARSLSKHSLAEPRDEAAADGPGMRQEYDEICEGVGADEEKMEGKTHDCRSDLAHTHESRSDLADAERERHWISTTSRSDLRASLDVDDVEIRSSVKEHEIRLSETEFEITPADDEDGTVQTRQERNEGREREGEEWQVHSDEDRDERKEESEDYDNIDPGLFSRLVTRYPICVATATAVLFVCFVVVIGIPQLQQGFEGYDARDRYEAQVSDGKQSMPAFTVGGEIIKCFVPDFGKSYND